MAPTSCEVGAFAFWRERCAENDVSFDYETDKSRHSSTAMRANEIKQYNSILQTLSEPGCPLCAFLKNVQAKLLQEGDAEGFMHLCNAHTWAVAAVRQTATAARIFVSLLETRRAHGPHPCSICLRLEQEEVLRTQELIAAFARRSVLDWMRKQGVLCVPHGWRLRAEAPAALHAMINEVLEKRASELRKALEDLLAEAAHGESQHGGVLGRVAEYLAAQRGISLHRIMFHSNL